MTTTNWDVVVIGGGPAGASCAIALARSGRQVLVLEREAVARPRMGESLSPAAVRHLKAVGLSDHLAKADSVVKTGATFSGGTGSVSWTVRYGGRAGDTRAVHLRREELDGMLLTHAAERGVWVRHGCRVSGIRWEGGRACGVRYQAAEETAEATARWVVDASGQHCVIGNELGLLRYDDRLRKTALWSRWENGKRLPSVDAGNTLIFAGTGSTCLWYFPVNDASSLVSVGVVTDDCADPTRGETAAFYQQAIASSGVAPLLTAAQQVAAVRREPASAYCCARLAGPGWLLVGDAAWFADPILTAGVQFALESGALAASVINTVLTDPESEGKAAASYDTLCRGNYQTFVSLCRNLYAAASSAPAAPQGPGVVTSVPGPGGIAGQLAFLSCISGLSPLELPGHLDRYKKARQRALADGLPPAFSEEEGFSFLGRHVRERVLHSTRPARSAGRPEPLSVVRLAAGAQIGEALFLGTDGLTPPTSRRAVVNRLGDRFEATPEAEALFKIIGDGGTCAELEVQFWAALGTPPDTADGAFCRWLDLLAENLLVEWGPAIRPEEHQ